jgi:DNA-binding GntR family transcriptional regulator
VTDVQKLNPDDPRPPYLQVADALSAAISAGEFVAGGKLPSYETLAEAFGVSLGVVKRAMAQLRADGAVVSRQGQGAYVRSERAGDDRVPTLAALRAEMARMNERLAAVERRLAKLD